MIITLAGPKGGTGKSTLAIHLGVEWALRGDRVLLVDCDPQSTLITWGETRAATGMDAPTVMPAGDNVREAVRKLADGWDMVLIDTAGRQSKRLVGALAISDLALMPCRPSGPDIWALQQAIETVNDVREVRPELRMGLIMNFVTATRLSRMSMTTIADKLIGVPIIATIGQRTAIAEATTSGEGVTEREPDGLGASEVRAACNRVEELMRG